MNKVVQFNHILAQYCEQYNVNNYIMYLLQAVFYPEMGIQWRY